MFYCTSGHMGVIVLSFLKLADLSNLISILLRCQIDQKKLGEVYLRLGDLQRTNGNFAQAVEDYLQSLSIYSAVVDAGDRILADVRTFMIHHLFRIVLQTFADTLINFLLRTRFLDPSCSAVALSAGHRVRVCFWSGEGAIRGAIKRAQD